MTTPGESGIYLKSSEPVQFSLQHPMTEENLSAGSMAGIAVGILFLLLLGAAAFFVLLKRCKQKTVEESANDNVAMSKVTQNADVVYANMATTATSENDTSKTRIPLNNLQTTYNDLLCDNSSKLQKQFLNLKREGMKLYFPTLVASSPSVAAKNRYKNVLPADHSRIVLSTGESGYINASYIHGSDQAKRYIATQGPLLNTIEQFWLMVLEQKSTIIVMLARCTEGRKNTCAKYWPTNKSVVSFGPVTVKCVSEDNHFSFVVRTLTVSCNRQTHTVEHIHFLTWPDHGVPSTTTGLIKCHETVSNIQTDAPIIVHCCAGAGRTGVFIAYDILKCEGISTGSVDVYACIMKMRKNRSDMVQTIDQYKLIHKLLVEIHQFGDTSLTPDKIVNKINWKTDSEKEFENLSLIGPLNQERVITEDSSFNRDPEVTPYRRNYVTIAKRNDEVTVPYINASVLESYDPCIRIIATQEPLETTKYVFWRAVWDNNVKTIVSLTLSDSFEKGKEQSLVYWPDDVLGSVTFNDITIALTSKGFERRTIRRQMDVTRNGHTMELVHYQYLGWDSDSCPKDPTDVLNLVEKVSTKTHSEKDTAVLIHCSDGAGRTGTFCAIFNLVMRLKTNRDIDVFRTAKDLRDCRPKMITTLDQYQFCYRTIIEYLKANNTYAVINENGESSNNDLYEIPLQLTSCLK